MKTCIQCGEAKGIDQFDRRPANRDGRCNQCKQCRAAYSKAWRDANRADLLAKKKAYYRENKAEIDEKNRKWAQTETAKNYRKRYYRENKDRLTNAELLRRYGITLNQYDEMYEDQDGKCSICREADPAGRKLAVDHCHTTGQNRGLLCLNCNQGIGKFKDNPELLMAAAWYLVESQTYSSPTVLT